MMKTWRSTWLMGTFVALTACGGSDNTGGGTPEPCGLLDAAAVDAFISGTSTVAYQDDTNCRMEGGSTSVSVALFPSSSESSYMNARSAHGNVEDVPTLGSFAHYAPSLMTVQFLQGTLIVSVQVVFTATSSKSAAEVKTFVIGLATTARNRL